MNQEEVIKQCVNGERDRTCDSCPAHNSRNGKCCFGVMHQYGDADCQQCHIEADCAQLAHSPQPKAAEPYINRMVYPNSAPTQPTSIYPTRGSLPIVNSPRPTAQSSSILPPPVHTSSAVQPLQFPDTDSIFVKAVKHGGYGALEGFFNMVSSFLHKRRPE